MALSRRSTPRVDMHVHSTCSGDGASSIVEYAQVAVDLGLAEVGFCEHADFDPRDSGYGNLNLERYDRELASGRAAAPEVRLRKGVEVTYQSSREEEIRGWVLERSWDFVVVSVHLVDYPDGWAIISDPAAMSDYFASHSQRQVYVPYFEELLRAARSGLGDVLGHFDLVKRYGTAYYGPFEPADFEDEIREVLHIAVERGMGLEVNSSGLRQPPKEPYPSLAVLRWYRELGGELLTVGSDAHHTAQLGSGMAHVLDLACKAGFQAIASFADRQPLWMDL